MSRKKLQCDLQVSSSLSMAAADFNDAPTVKFLYQVYRSTRLQEMALTGWSPDQVDTFLHQQFQFQHRDYVTRFKDAGFYILLFEQKPCGRLYLDETPEHLMVIDIALLPEFRQQGLGTAVLEHVKAYSKKTGKPVFLHVDNTNPCRDLYARLGFRVKDTGPLQTLMFWQPDRVLPANRSQRGPY